MAAFAGGDMAVSMLKVLAMSWYLCFSAFLHDFYAAGQLRTPIVYLMQWKIFNQKSWMTAEGNLFLL